MGNSLYSKFTPGFKPDDTIPPRKMENCESILEAYQKAVEFINEDDHQQSYCTIGPKNWLMCWRTSEEAKLSVKKVKDNVILCYDNNLKITFPDDVDPSKITVDNSNQQDRW